VTQIQGIYLHLTEGLDNLPKVIRTHQKKLSEHIRSQ